MSIDNATLPGILRPGILKCWHFTLCNHDLQRLQMSLSLPFSLHKRKHACPLTCTRTDTHTWTDAHIHTSHTRIATKTAKLNFALLSSWHSRLNFCLVVFCLSLTCLLTVALALSRSFPPSLSHAPSLLLCESCRKYEWVTPHVTQHAYM